VGRSAPTPAPPECGDEPPEVESGEPDGLKSEEPETAEPALDDEGDADVLADLPEPEPALDDDGEADVLADLPEPEPALDDEGDADDPADLAEPVSAAAIPGIDAIAAPTPNATANAPTRPTAQA